MFKLFSCGVMPGKLSINEVIGTVITGAFGPCPALYDRMEIKHIMNDTLG